MSQQVTRQIALMTVFATCILVVALLVGFGLGAKADAELLLLFSTPDSPFSIPGSTPFPIPVPCPSPQS